VLAGTLTTNAHFSNGTLNVVAGLAQVTSRATSNSPGGATVVPAVSVATPTGTLDLTNNALIIDYVAGNSPIATIANLIKTGYAGGSWTGAGITSSSAAAVALSADVHKTALGFAEASAIGLGSGSFAGQSLDSSSLIIGYALSGDANLDGNINTPDFNMLATNFNASTQLWTSGDFNFDGKVNALDFNAIATNFGAAFTSTPLSLGFLVPEPVLVTTVAFIPLWICRQRRRLMCTRF
jgi:hypothetical protein